MELTKAMHQYSGEQEFQDVLKNTRVGHPSEENTESIMSLHLNRGCLNVKQISEIEEKATYIFANQKNMREHKRECLI
jgi:hypothetical protein